MMQSENNPVAATGMAKGAIFVLSFLGPAAPVVWHGETAMGNYFIGHPIIDGLQCNHVRIRFHKTDIERSYPSGPSAPVV